MKILRRIKAYYKLTKNQRFLKKHGCTTWRQYNRLFDPDVINRATLVSQYYHGYPYLCYFEEAPPASQGDWRVWYQNMRAWCEKNCEDKFREDIHRVIRERGLIHNEYDDTITWSEIDEFSMNDVAGWDILFFAFKSEKDLIWFKLTWQ